MNKVLLAILLANVLLFSAVPNSIAQISHVLVMEENPDDIIIDTGMQINLVLVGEVWSEEEKAGITKRLLQSYTPMISSEERAAGVRYNFTYNFRSEPQKVSDELFKFIDSIAVETPVPYPIRQWMFVQRPTLESENILYKLIDAMRVEGSLAKLEREKGYTIYFLKPPTTQLGYLHTYGALTKDPDTGRNFVQEGMMGFGGKNRFYFIDLSAGPWLYPFIPVSETQAISEFHQNILDLETDEGYYKLLAEYVNDAIMLLFTPSYLYSPTYRLNYRMEILLIDMTSGRTFNDVSKDYIKREIIEDAFAKLIPYAKWTSEVTGQKFDSLPRELQQAILRSLTYQKTGGGETILVKSSEFIEELRSWTKTTLTEEESRLQQEEAESTVVVPLILFVFDTDAYVDKISVVGSAIPDPADKTVPWGTIVAADKHALFDLGTGLSTLAMHEMGHVVGLRHPHDGFSHTAGEFHRWFFDWSYTPMTYASPTILGCGLVAERCGLVINEFGAFNLDTIDRGLALSLLRQAVNNLHNATLQLQQKGYDNNSLPEDLRSKLSTIEEDVERSKELFGEMNYFNYTSFSGTTKLLDEVDDAFDFALKALTDSRSFARDIIDLPTITPIGSETLSGVNTLEVSGLVFIDENSVQSNVQEILEPIMIKSMVSNKADQLVNFNMHIQIKDSSGFTVSLTSFDGSISPGETAEPSSSFTFERSGEYIIEIFLWKSLDDPVPLSALQRTTITLVR